MDDLGLEPQSDASDGSTTSESVEIITDTMVALSVKPNFRKSRFLQSRPIPETTTMAAQNWDADRAYHNSMCATDLAYDGNNNVHLEETRTTPLFSADVLAKSMRHGTSSGFSTPLLPEYGFLGRVIERFDASAEHSPGGNLLDNVTPPASPHMPEDDRLMVNMNAPWSAFICGSQGTGKSHTLSCMLENALKRSRMGKLPHPLTGIVFHYDKFTGFSNTQVCEAAYLASSGIPVKVLVSPSNFGRMKDVYRDLPGFPPNAQKPTVAPLLLREKHLNVARMMKLMAVDEKDGRMALYMESVCRILRSMAMQNQGAPGIDFEQFTRRLDLETMNEGQKAMLNTRLQLLTSFMDLSKQSGTGQKQKKKNMPNFPSTKEGRRQAQAWYAQEEIRARAEIAKANIWTFQPGSLTIVDLSCPFVDESAACVMFNICLALFLEDRAQAGRIVALDEAHKFMTATSSSSEFTESLLSVIRQQRHLATRVIIATQEPTISPALLDLSSMTIVHRFTSPNWLTALKSHLAGVSSEGGASERDVADIFQRIVHLNAGQALLFSPSAMLGIEGNGDEAAVEGQKLGTGYLKVQIRKRLTADGGRSILAAT